MNILISNNVPFHYEIIESVILKYDEIFNIQKAQNDKIFLKLEKDIFEMPPNLNYDIFINYISNKYKNIIIINDLNNLSFDYEVHCTAQHSRAKDTHGGVRPAQMINSKNIVYIAHCVDDELLNIDNVLFLSKFNRNDIPNNRVFIPSIIQYSDIKIKTKVPTFIVQGSFTRSKFDATRDYAIIDKILSEKYDKDFNIKFIGRWKENSIDYSEFLNLNTINPYNKPKISIKLNQNWNDFCLNFISADVIIPSISKNNNPNYFEKEMTSSFIYANSHDIKVFADQDFFDVYKIDKSKHRVYNQDNICEKFNDLLNELYQKKEM